ncbi:hypothetical protein M427DRAFT_59347 [Gonapodya prolifera JEL478]|uniref:Uncharacterized protein n=1 Tax=Gonapodya prolifera (strain JEL478) TaxID=1344416 RepID=A0A139A700_GONPJ|nr:hypothetical protein M427DRAFT_59347 [Gonapodya prolifera JEL478]|eukprot:KXS12606.1 hypothetical protein M427DRAFT_59347 [Gonapodya prolifera JEL478]
MMHHQSPDKQEAFGDTEDYEVVEGTRKRRTILKDETTPKREKVTSQIEAVTPGLSAGTRALKLESPTSSPQPEESGELSSQAGASSSPAVSSTVPNMISRDTSDVRQDQPIAPPTQTDEEAFSDDDDDEFWQQAAKVADEAEFKAGRKKREPILVNRAPVLTLWVTVVCVREGYSRGTALSIAKYVASEYSQTKGKSLGVIPTNPTDKESAFQQSQRRDAVVTAANALQYPAFGMAVWCVETRDGLRAFLVDKGKSLEAKGIERYLDDAFGAAKEEAEKVLVELAECFTSADVGNKAYSLYERFRPPWMGWGMKGEFRLEDVEELTWRIRRGEKVV